MKNYINKHKKVIMGLFGIMMLFIFTMTGEAYTEKIATINVTGILNVRSGAGTSYGIVATIGSGNKVTVIGEATANDGAIWYQIRFQKENQTIEGYVSSVYLQFSVEIAADQNFEAYLTEQGFPESYKDSLRQLHTLYPNWTFVAQKTGLDWNTVVSNEAALGKNLVTSGSISSWKSIQSGAYNWDTSTWVGFDGSGWVAASEEIIKYYLDPRNFLGEDTVFQFLNHSYNASNQNSKGVNGLLQNTFMSGSVTEESTAVSYADILMEAAEKTGVNPYVLAAMILQEQGSSGTGKSISGIESGYEGYYNYFNIEAYASGTMTAVQRGLWYASQSGSYSRPWNSVRLSIAGGSEYYGTNYVKAGQNTFYLKKFNVQGSNLYKHQYMTNVQGAASEALKLAAAYNADIKNASLEFRIPVYSNLPGNKCAMPTGDGNPNNLLGSLSIDNYNLTPSFDKNTGEYNLIVDTSVSSINVNAAALYSKATVSGTGKITLSSGTNTIVVTVKAENGTTKDYTIHVARGGGSASPGQTTVTMDYTLTEAGMIRGVSPLTTSEEYLKKVQVTNGTAKLFLPDGAEASGKVGTGNVMRIYDTSGTIQKEYQIVIKGDVNGDGNINGLDLLKIQKYLLGAGNLDGIYFTAADVNDNNKVDALDLLKIQKDILGIEKLPQ